MSSNPSNKAAVDPKTSSNGSSEGQKLLQPDERVAYTAVSATPTQAQVTAIRDALITAGIMKSS